MARIVVVEDDGALRNDIADRLNDWGYEVIEAANGRQGFDAIERFRPDLVLSDINMPMGSGFDLVERVRSLGVNYADMAFLFISGLSAPNAVAHGINRGADDYIVKPVDYGVLKAKIEAHLRKRTDLVAKLVSGQLFPSRGDVAMNGVIFASVLGALGILWLVGLYLVKMVLGINIFQDAHLTDLFR